MEKSKNSFIAIGLMLFALFFGAGNLIFPVFMGQNSGVETIPATIGFLLTGVGLPILGIAAIGYSGDDLQKLASRICTPYAIFFTVALYLTIGPAFAIPVRLRHLLKSPSLRSSRKKAVRWLSMASLSSSSPFPGGSPSPRRNWSTVSAKSSLRFFWHSLPCSSSLQRSLRSDLAGCFEGLHRSDESSFPGLP